MSEEKKNQFARLLRYYLSLNNKQQIDLVNDLNFDKSTVSGWCNGSRVPKVDVIIRLADYLNVVPGDLIIETSQPINYCLDNETAKTAKEIFDNDKILLEVYNSPYRDRLVEYARKLKELHDMDNI